MPDTPASDRPAPVFEHELALALACADDWQAHARQVAHLVAQALATLGDIRLPDAVVPPHDRQALATLGSLYLVNELEGLVQAAEKLVALWASGALQMHLPKLEPLLAKAWKERHLRLSRDERQHLLALAFNPQEFAPAMRRLCGALTALADNAHQRDVREEVGLQQAAESVLELAALRLVGAPTVASAELVAQLREATQWLGDRSLQLAMGAHDLVSLARACLITEPALAADLEAALERARGGSVVLQWIATHAATGFAIDPRDPGLQAVIAAAQRWLLSAPGGAVAAAPLLPTIAGAAPPVRAPLAW
jgi:hypothetical protein